MKKTVLTFGVSSGLIMSAMMLATLPLLHKIPSGKAMILGYTTMVLAGLLVFFGIRSYRENVSGGRITFAWRVVSVTYMSTATHHSSVASASSKRAPPGVESTGLPAKISMPRT